jgi:hypothetical protein
MREPDPPGFAGWVSTINNCSTDHPGHPELCDRVHVAQNFFQSQEFQQRGYFVYRFAVEVEGIVRELNKVYPEKFDGDLRLVPGPNIELQCGLNPVFEASIFNSTMLKVTRYERVGIAGEMKAKPDHYVAQVESGKFLCFEWKDGSTICPADMGKELFGFLTD